MKDQKNLIFFVVVFLSIMVGWNYFYQPPKVEQQPIDKQVEQTQLPTAFGDLTKPEKPRDRSEIVGEAARVPIKTDKVQGSLNLKGARLDDITLLKYRETVEKDSPNVTLLSPEGSEHPYFAEFGWTSQDQSLKLPDSETVWAAADPNTPSIAWDNGEGLVFQQSYKIDENYNISVAQSVINNTEKPVKLFPYGNVTRVGTPETAGFFILHEVRPPQFG